MTIPSTVGFGRSSKQTFTIPSTANGSAVAPINLERSYAFLAVWCHNTDGIAGSTTLSAEVSPDEVEGLVDLWTLNGEAAWVSGTLPDADGDNFFFIIPAALGVQQIRFILSNVATADVVLNVYGFDPAVG